MPLHTLSRNSIFTCLKQFTRLFSGHSGWKKIESGKMRALIILSILGTFLTCCHGQNASTNSVDNSTKSPTKLPGISDEDSQKKQIDVHESLLHRLIPERSHRVRKPAPKMSFLGDLTDIHENKTGNNPRNVILVMLEGTEGDDQWLKFKENLTFFTERVLQKCSGEDNSTCEWKQMLMDGINGLILWARQVERMNIGTVSGGNLTLPSVFHFDNSPILGPKIFIDKPYEMPLAFPDPAPKLGNNSVNSFPGKVNDSAQIPLTFHPYSTEAEGDKEPWDFLDVISKIRLAVFQTFLDSLHGTFGANEEDLPPVGIFPERYPRDSPGVVNILATTLQDLQSIPTENGYLLIAVAGSQELLDIAEMLREKTSVNNTLLVLTALRKDNTSTVPVFASGPGSFVMNTTGPISDIPKFIKSSLEKRHETNQERPLSLRPQDMPRIRVSRSDDDDEMSEGGEEVGLEETGPDASSTRHHNDTHGLNLGPHVAKIKSAKSMKTPI